MTMVMVLYLFFKGPYLLEKHTEVLINEIIQRLRFAFNYFSKNNE